MNIIKYITNNWNKVPKSRFDNEEVVIVAITTDDDWGFGKHSFNGLAVNESGMLLWCYSSGCSCNGGCDTSLIKEGEYSAKTLEVSVIDSDLTIRLNSINPDDLPGLQRVFHTY